MLNDRMAFPFMSIPQDGEGISPDYMSCIINALRDVLLFHGTSNIRRRLVQPLSFIFEVDKARSVWLSSNAESLLMSLRFHHGLSAQWHALSGLHSSMELVQRYQAQGKVVIFRTDWSKVPYSTMYLKQGAHWHVALGIAIFPEKCLLYVADRSSARADPPFLENRGFVKYGMLAPALDDYFLHLDYLVSEPEESWSDELRNIIIESISNMISRDGIYSSHQEYGLRGIQCLGRFIQDLDLEELATRNMQQLLRRAMPHNIRACVLGSRNLFFSVLNESYPLEECGLRVLADQIQQGWRRFSRLLTIFGRERSEERRQDCLSQIDELVNLEQQVVSRLAALVT